MTWKNLELWLEQVAFNGKIRKNGSPMFEHSVDVGRRLRTLNCDNITIFAGYCHDVIEDVIMTCDNEAEKVKLSYELYKNALDIFKNQEDADKAIETVNSCSYQPIEYREEEAFFKETGDKKKAKLLRKDMAIERWLNSDDRVKNIKICDVKSNLVTAQLVSPEFYKDYTSWAVPLMEKLENDLSVSSRLSFT